jgi:predicted SAM-dependent methyltransferase
VVETATSNSVENGVQVAATEPVVAEPIRLDIGCGRNKINDGRKWIGVDALNFPGVDVILNLVERELVPDSCTPNLQGAHTYQCHLGAYKSWPWKDGEVDEVHCSHFLEHLTGAERIHFFNELYRVLKPGGQARIITPHWSHERAYGDPTHQWPPVCSWTYFYLDAPWREVNAPHTGYNCDFTYVLAGTHDPNDEWVAFRTMEVKQVYMSRNINTTTDLIATLTKKVLA